MKPTLSVITSVLNPGVEEIKKTMFSILPIPDDVEWVYIDGGSNDDSLNEVIRYVEVEIHPETTLYGGFNWGWRHAKGDYVYYLNAGDIILSGGLLGELATIIRNHENPSDVYYFDAKVNETTLFPMAPDLKTIFYKMPFSHQGCVVKRDVIKSIGGFSEYSGPTADHELLVKLFMKGCEFSEISDLCLTQCAEWKSTEDDLGRLLNRWRNIRNLFFKNDVWKPKVNQLDKLYKKLLIDIE